ncbi:metal-dependent hydrolase [Rubrobacter tropicus]|uniref:Metal-dependent hydrolase n=2 Tax=Rubrobacter tropicus TaxID=2653851 RepID=A0A6G8QFI0_9ACTN|nr:metal-dependent hydrolase [Rubrobacter tropicus]
MAVVAVMVVATEGGARGSERRDVRVMSYNIHHGEGADGRLDLDRIAGVIRSEKAEVVGLQEVDRFWRRSDFVDQVDYLAEELDMYAAYGANLDLPPDDPSQPRRRYGTAILSKYPIIESGNTFLPRLGTSEQRGLLEALIKVKGAPVRFYNTHLQHNSSEERALQVRAIMEHTKDVEGPQILVGDLNALPGAPELAPLYGRYDDAWTLGGEGPGYTIGAENPNRRIDYVFVTPDVAVRSASVPRTLASDHLPVVAELSVPRKAR